MFLIYSGIYSLIIHYCFIYIFKMYHFISVAWRILSSLVLTGGLGWFVVHACILKTMFLKNRGHPVLSALSECA